MFKIFSILPPFLIEESSKPQHFLATPDNYHRKTITQWWRLGEGHLEHRLLLLLATNWFVQFLMFPLPPDDFYSPRATAVNPITGLVLCTSVNKNIKTKIFGDVCHPNGAATHGWEVVVTRYCTTTETMFHPLNFPPRLKKWKQYRLSTTSLLMCCTVCIVMHSLWLIAVLCVLYLETKCKSSAINCGLLEKMRHTRSF